MCVCVHLACSHIHLNIESEFGRALYFQKGLTLVLCGLLVSLSMILGQDRNNTQAGAGVCNNGWVPFEGLGNG